MYSGLIGACLMVVALFTAAAPAGAAPGAYRVLIVEANCGAPEKLRAQIDAFADVAAVDVFDACVGTPSVAQLRAYDLVVSMSNDFYLDRVAYGDALADYVDSKGVVVQFAYDNWDGDGGDDNGPGGRFASGGYEPFLPGDNPNEVLTLGEFDRSSPLMSGMSALSAERNTAPALAPGATLIAKWSDGSNLIASKGRVVSVSAYVGENSDWSGDFARLAVNAVRLFAPPGLRIENFTPGGGTVAASPESLGCDVGGFFCERRYGWGTTVTVTAAPNKGFAFSGFFDGACVGPTCAIVMDSDKTVKVNFVRFAPMGKAKRNPKEGTALLTVRVGGPGELTLTGKNVKRQAKQLAADANLKIPVIAKGKAAKKLKGSGKAKVGFKVTFTPASGTTTSFSKSLVLLRGTRGS